jgi:hypothetical protein
MKQGTKYFVLPSAVSTSFSKMLAYTKTKCSIPPGVHFTKVKYQDDPIFLDVKIFFMAFLLRIFRNWKGMKKVRWLMGINLESCT